MTTTVLFQDDFSGAAGTMDGLYPDIGNGPWTATDVSLQGDGTCLCTDVVNFPRQGMIRSGFEPGNLQGPGYMEFVFRTGPKPGSGEQSLTVRCAFADVTDTYYVPMEITLGLASSYANARIDVSGSVYVNDLLPLLDLVGDNVVRMEWVASGKITTKLNGTMIDNTASFASRVTSGLTWFEAEPRVNWGDSRTPITNRWRLSKIEIGMTPPKLSDTAFVLDEFNGPYAALGGHVPDISPGGVAWDADGGREFFLLGNGVIRHEVNDEEAINELHFTGLPLLKREDTLVLEVDFTLGAAYDSKRPKLVTWLWVGSLWITVTVMTDYLVAGTANVGVNAYIYGQQFGASFTIPLDTLKHRVRCEANLTALKMYTYIDHVIQPAEVRIATFDAGNGSGYIHVGTTDFSVAPTTSHPTMARLMAALKGTKAPPPFWGNYANCLEFASES